MAHRRAQVWLGVDLPDDLDGVMPMTPADPVGAEVVLVQCEHLAGLE